MCHCVDENMVKFNISVLKRSQFLKIVSLCFIFDRLFKLSDSLGATHQLHHCWMPRKFFDSSQCIKSRSAISGVIFMQQASDMCIKPYKIRSEIKSPLNHLLYRSFQKWLGYDLRLCIKSKLVMFQSELRNEHLNLAENSCFRLGHLYTYAVNGHIEEGGGY